MDFYCPKASLAIEVDGRQHFERNYGIKDCERDVLLLNIGIKVLRFDNRQVLMETDAVLKVIHDELFQRLNIIADS